jgi:hypothetical protein
MAPPNKGRQHAALPRSRRQPQETRLIHLNYAKALFTVEIDTMVSTAAA